MPDGDLPQGVIRTKEGEVVILLPASPIRSTVEGSSGQIYTQVLHDDAQLGRPTAKIEPIKNVT